MLLLIKYDVLTVKFASFVAGCTTACGETKKSIMSTVFPQYWLAASRMEY